MSCFCHRISRSPHEERLAGDIAVPILLGVREDVGVAFPVCDSCRLSRRSRRLSSRRSASDPLLRSSEPSPFRTSAGISAGDIKLSAQLPGDTDAAAPKPGMASGESLSGKMLPFGAMSGEDGADHVCIDAPRAIGANREASGIMSSLWNRK